MCNKFENLKETIAKVVEYKDVVCGETSTRRVMIDPILCSLGYDTSNPYEVINEYTCDFGVKKGEKVDYALMKNADITIIVEAKSIEVDLSVEHISQLYRYYSVTDAQIGVLTNGLEYWFFMDTKDKNKMDDKPFLKLNIEKLSEEEINLFLMFHKDDYMIERIKSIFESLSVRSSVKDFLSKQTDTLDEDFAKLIIDKLSIGMNADEFSKILKEELKTLLAFNKNNSMLNCTKSINSSITNDNGNKVVCLKDITSQICTGSKVNKIVIEGNSYDIKSWADAIQTLVNHIAINNNDSSWLSCLDGNPVDNKGFIRRNKENFLKCIPIGNTGLYLDTHGSSYMHIQRMKVVCRNAKLGLDNVVMYLY